MNSRERIEAMFAGKTPDRVGRFEQSVYSSVASKILGRPAITGGTEVHRDEAEAWLAGDTAHDEFLEKLYGDRAEIGRVLKFDAISLGWRFAARPAKKVSENEYLYGDPDGDWELYRYDPESETFGRAASSQGKRSIEDLKDIIAEGERRTAEPADESEDPWLRRLVDDFGDELAVLGYGAIVIPLEEDWLMACATDPGLVGAYLDLQLESTLRSFRAQAKMGIAIIWGGGDFADNSGPVYGPKVFRALMLPRLKKMMDECRRLGIRYLFRSDGNLWTVTDMMFKEAEIDGYGEVDWAAGMDLADLKPRYPDITYWGNVPPPLVRNGTKEQVLAAARHCIDAFPDKRLIFGCSNAILKDTPVENALALTEAVEMWG
ncbi:MAG: uroporphyrinogen decarboxylase family protein [Planctomycetota bacterium]